MYFLRINTMHDFLISIANYLGFNTVHDWHCWRILFILNATIFWYCSFILSTFFSYNAFVSTWIPKGKVLHLSWLGIAFVLGILVPWAMIAALKP